MAVEYVDRRTTHNRFSFMAGPQEIAYREWIRAELDPQLVIAPNATGAQIDEMVSSGKVDEVTALAYGIFGQKDALGEQMFDLSRLTKLATARVWFVPVPESLFTAPSIRDLEIGSCTPAFASIGRPYPALRRLTIRGFQGKKALTSLPSDIENLLALEEFEATGVGLKALPDAFGTLPLRRVVVDGAKGLKQIPRRFGPKLEELTLRGTGVKAAPDTSASPGAKISIG